MMKVTNPDDPDLINFCSSFCLTLVSGQEDAACSSQGSAPLHRQILKFFVLRVTRVNGFPWLDSKLATAEHFFFSGFHILGNTSNPVGGKVTHVNVGQIPSLNTLGISLARIDYAPWDVIPPHTYPHVTEILTVLEGNLNVGFVTSNPDNKLISKVLNKGDMFVFPIGLVHYQKNAGNGIAISLSSLSSQNPGVNTIANAVFGFNLAISEDVLAKSFQLQVHL
ncbi:hypothetical protein ACFX2J_014320 [Malus domestica]